MPEEKPSSNFSLGAIHPAALGPPLNIYEALARFHAQVPTIVKDREVVVRPRDQSKRSYTFRYAQLETILAAIRKPLADNGLALVQRILPTEKGEEIQTALHFVDGAVLHNNVRMIVLDQGPQAYGSAQMYARRQGITLLLTLAAEEDDDANAAEGNEVERAKPQEDVIDLIPYGPPKPSALPPDLEVVAEYAKRIIGSLDNRDPGGALLLYRELSDPEKMALWRNGGLTMKYKQVLRDGMNQSTKAGAA